MVVLDQMAPSKILVAIASGMTFDERFACMWLLSPLLDSFFLSDAPILQSNLSFSNHTC